MKSVEQEPLLYFYKGDRSPLAHRRSWLAWLLNLAQQPESECEAGIAEMGLREFADSLKPQLQVDWEAEPFGASPTKSLRMMKRRMPARPVKDAVCKHCGRPGVYHTKPNRWDRTGSWYCELHEAAAYQQEAEESESDSLMPSLKAANPPKAPGGPTVRPQGTDLSPLLHEVLTGLNSFLANNEWTFPPLTLTPTVRLSSGKQAKPERHMMGTLRDVILAGISDLLMEHSHKVRRCKARDCGKAFLAVRRQMFCSKRCSSNTRSNRFQKRLGRKGFRERRHRYYIRHVERVSGRAVATKVRKRKGA